MYMEESMLRLFKLLRELDIKILRNQALQRSWHYYNRPKAEKYLARMIKLQGRY